MSQASRHLVSSAILAVMACLALITLSQGGAPVAQAGGQTCGEPTPRRYRPCEVILTGLGPEMDELVGQAQAAGITLRPAGPQATVRVGRRLVRRYRIHNAETTPTPQIVARLREMIRQRQWRIGADPNRVIGAPWEISGSPWQRPEGPNIQLARPYFESQWAFRAGSGIGLKDAQNQRRTPYTGAGISIGVFDTAPFSVTASIPISMTYAQVNFTLLDPPPVETPPAAVITQTTSSHGLFIVGLLAEVAPASRITLVRVLDDEGHGTVFRLHQALSHYIEWDRARPDFVAGVLNLSLSVDLDYASAMVLDNVETLKDVLDEARELGFVVVTSTGNNSTSDRIEPPQFPASHPGVIGVTSVNAEGQRSCFANAGQLAAPGGDGDCTAQAQTYPPAPSLSGKGGSDAPPLLGEGAGERSGATLKTYPLAPSLSGKGGTDAPPLPGEGSGEGSGATLKTYPPTPSLSGKGGLDAPPLPGEGSGERSADGPGCEQGDPDRQCLISLMKVDGNPSRFGYWAGTSFAAPLVSGLAALVLEQSWVHHGVVLTPDAVAARLYAGARRGDNALGHGRIDVMRTLSPYRVYLPTLHQGASPTPQMHFE